MPRDVRTVRNHSAGIILGIRNAAEKAIAKAVFDIEAKAKANVTDIDAVDTGALRASIYSGTSRNSTYGKASSDAQSEASSGSVKKPGSGSKKFDMRAEVKARAMEGVVVVGAEYGEFIEIGTVSMAGRPYLAPAADEIIPVFDKVIAKITDEELKKYA